MSEVQKIQNTLLFCDSILSQELEIEKKPVLYWLGDFLKGFSEIYEEEKKKLPYHINVIDLLHADENAHSRILGKLLQQKSNDNQYGILTSFVQYLVRKSKNTSFENLRFTQPETTVETERIDIWIRDKTTKYALIIENKVHWAKDQGEQLRRYIDKTLDHGFKKENIFVVYLPPAKNKDPEDQSWGTYKDEFKDRYLKITFRDDILPWLKEDVLPNIKNKEVFLRSALEQYIDHIEGEKMFQTNKLYHKMNEELKNYIKSELKLNNNKHNENLSIIKGKIAELEKVKEMLEQIRNEEEKNSNRELLKEWKNKLKEEYPNTYDTEREGYDLFLNVPLKYKDKEFNVSFAHHTDDDNWYYGETTNNRKRELEIEKLISEIRPNDFNPEDKDLDWYPYYKSEKQIDGIYDEFKSLLDSVASELKKRS